MGKIARRQRRAYGPHPADIDVGWLFVGGCSRSGTTAMAHFLNDDERMVVGIERYKYVRRPLQREHFAPQVFFNPIPQETNGLFEAEGIYPRLRERWARGGVRLLGDKHPHHVRRLQALDAAFPAPRHLIMVRDLVGVANSFHRRATNPRDAWPARNDYEVAVEHWKTAITQARAYHDAGAADRLFLVDYEGLFSGDERQHAALYRFLGLDMPEAMAERIATMQAEWPRRAARPLSLPDQAVEFLERTRDAELEAWARERIAEQLA